MMKSTGTSLSNTVMNSTSLAKVPTTILKSELKVLELPFDERDCVFDYNGQPTGEVYFCPNYSMSRSHQDLKAMFKIQRKAMNMIKKLDQTLLLGNEEEEEEEEANNNIAKLNKNFTTSNNVEKSRLRNIPTPVSSSECSRKPTKTIRLSSAPMLRKYVELSSHKRQRDYYYQQQLQLSSSSHTEGVVIPPYKRLSPRQKTSTPRKPYRKTRRKKKNATTGPNNHNNTSVARKKTKTTETSLMVELRRTQQCAGQGKNRARNKQTDVVDCEDFNILLHHWEVVSSESSPNRKTASELQSGLLPNDNDYQQHEEEHHQEEKQQLLMYKDDDVEMEVQSPSPVNLGETTFCQPDKHVSTQDSVCSHIDKKDDVVSSLSNIAIVSLSSDPPPPPTAAEATITTTTITTTTTTTTTMTEATAVESDDSELVCGTDEEIIHSLLDGAVIVDDNDKVHSTTELPSSENPKIDEGKEVDDKRLWDTSADIEARRTCNENSLSVPQSSRVGMEETFLDYQGEELKENKFVLLDPKFKEVQEEDTNDDIDLSQDKSEKTTVMMKDAGDIDVVHEVQEDIGDSSSLLMSNSLSLPNLEKDNATSVADEVNQTDVTVVSIQEDSSVVDASNITENTDWRNGGKDSTHEVGDVQDNADDASPLPISKRGTLCTEVGTDSITNQIDTKISPFVEDDDVKDVVLEPKDPPDAENPVVDAFKDAKEKRVVEKKLGNSGMNEMNDSSSALSISDVDSTSRDRAINARMDTTVVSLQEEEDDDVVTNGSESEDPIDVEVSHVDAVPITAPMMTENEKVNYTTSSAEDQQLTVRKRKIPPSESELKEKKKLNAIFSDVVTQKLMDTSSNKLESRDDSISPVIRYGSKVEDTQNDVDNSPLVDHHDLEAMDSILRNTEKNVDKIPTCKDTTNTELEQNDDVDFCSKLEQQELVVSNLENEQIQESDTVILSSAENADNSFVESNISRDENKFHSVSINIPIDSRLVEEAAGVLPPKEETVQLSAENSKQLLRQEERSKCYATFEELKNSESLRRKRFLDQLEETRLRWDCYKDLCHAFMDEVNRSSNFLLGLSKSFENYAKAMRAVCNDCLVDDDGTIVTDPRKQKKLAVKRSDAAEIVMNRASEEQRPVAPVVGGGFQSDLLDPMYDSLSSLANKFEGFTHAASEEKAAELNTFRLGMLEEVRRLEKQGDCLFKDVESAEKEVQRIWEILCHVAVGSAGVKSSDDSSPPNKNKKKLLLNITMKESGGGDVQDYWLWEMLYFAVVSYAVSTWENSKQELECLYDAINELEVQRQSKLQEVTLAFLPGQRRIFRNVNEVLEPVIQKVQETHMDREGLEKSLIEALQQRSNSHRKGNFMHRSSIMNRSRSIKPVLEEVDEKETSLRPFGNPFLSQLIQHARIVECKKQAGWISNEWEVQLALITIDNYLHLFDIPNEIRADLLTSAESVFPVMMPSFDSSSTHGAAEKGDDDEKEIGLFKIPTPHYSLNLVKCSFIMNQQANAQLDIVERSTGRFNHGNRARCTLRLKSVQDVVEWSGLLQSYNRELPSLVVEEDVSDSKRTSTT